MADATRPGAGRAPLVLLGLFVAAYVTTLWLTAPSIGYTRDEGYYFKAAEEYGGWWEVLFSRRFFEAFTDAEIKRHFSYNTEHPALVKLVLGATHGALHRWLGVTTPAQAYRATGFLFAALSLVATFLLGRRLVGPWVGVLAAVLLSLEPRYFYDSHLACFDVPITAMWTLSLWAFVRALEDPRPGPAVLAGVIYGLALATKLNAFFLPFVFLPAWVWFRVERGAGAASQGPRLQLVRGPSGSLDLALPRAPLVFGALLVLSPLVFVAHWPHLWHDTFPRIGAYVGFHMSHEHYPASYFHELWVRPPFPSSFPFVMTLLTVPSPTLALGTLGLARGVWRALAGHSFRDATLVGATLLPILVIALPSTPIFGGVKHWHTAQPTLAILAAWALLDGIATLSLAARVRRPVAVGLGILVALPGALGVAASHPHGIGFYSELAGGLRGGAQLGMQRGFWGSLAGPLYFERALPERGRVFFNRTNWDAFRMYQREGIIAPGVSYANEPKGSTAGVVFEQPEHGETEAGVWSVIGTRPVRGVYSDNVTLTQLYVAGPSASPP
ncbi:MAG: glycosyltransferase family 39 protein [Deltaproteobacteria bacterium]|nr:glycosyltransferase family 39 protein [Deltaproteobacteria bacterium]